MNRKILACDLNKSLWAHLFGYERAVVKYSNVFRSSSSVSQEKSSGNIDSFVEVYKFSGVRVLSSISRLKIYQNVVTAIAIPSSICAHYSGLWESIHIPTISLGITSSIVLYSFSYLFNNIIGIVYFNEASSEVKLSFVNFWGKRVDVICPIDDIIPLSPVKRKFNLLSEVHRRSSSEILYLPNEHGIIIQNLLFDKIFFKVQIGQNYQKNPS